MQAIDSDNYLEYIDYVPKKKVLKHNNSVLVPTSIIKQASANLQEPRDNVQDLTDVQSHKKAIHIKRHPITSSDDIVNNIINLMQSIEAIDAKANVTLVYNVFAMINRICMQNDQLLDNMQLMHLIKSWYHEYIILHGITSLIPLHDCLYDCDDYSTENIKHMYIPIPSTEWINEKIKEYTAHLENANIRRTAKRAAPKYEVNEIIGAKDKEGRWWMSKILASFEYNCSIVYYVEFIGWGEKFNEFIADGFRLNKFNPKKHRYFRPAWQKSL